MFISAYANTENVFYCLSVMCYMLFSFVVSGFAFHKNISKENYNYKKTGNYFGQRVAGMDNSLN